MISQNTFALYEVLTTNIAKVAIVAISFIFYTEQQLKQFKDILLTKKF